MQCFLLVMQLHYVLWGQCIFQPVWAVREEQNDNFCSVHIATGKFQVAFVGETRFLFVIVAMIGSLLLAVTACLWWKLPTYSSKKSQLIWFFSYKKISWLYQYFFSPCVVDKKSTKVVLKQSWLPAFWKKIQNTQEIKRTLFIKTKQDITCKFSM